MKSILTGREFKPSLPVVYGHQFGRLVTSRQRLCSLSLLCLSYSLMTCVSIHAVTCTVELFCTFPAGNGTNCQAVCRAAAAVWVQTGETQLFHWVSTKSFEGGCLCCCRLAGDWRGWLWTCHIGWRKISGLLLVLRLVLRFQRRTQEIATSHGLRWG